MANPSLLLIDADALIQLLLTKSQKILRNLKKDYGVTSVIVPEVEIEVVSIGKFKARLGPQIRKAKSNGTITVLDSSNFGTIIGSDAELQKQAIGQSYTDIQSIGAQYNRIVDRGEAYTFAQAICLSQPAVSNDWSAIQALNKAGYNLPSPVLRPYDLVAFAFQNGTLTEKECNNFRKKLESEREFVPAQMRAKSFEDGPAILVRPLLPPNPARANSGYPPESGSRRIDDREHIAQCADLLEGNIVRLKIPNHSPQFR